MSFDPKKRENLTAAMKAEISSFLQAMLLDGLMEAKQWTTRDLVFHGGTSIHLVWNSPRYSEDLDFMISSERAEDLSAAVEASATRISEKIKSPDAPPRIGAMADAAITVTSSNKKMENENRNLLVFDVKWTHPTKHGTVRVKLEFYAVPPQVLHSYQSGQGFQGSGIPEMGLQPAVRADILPDRKLFMAEDLLVQESVPVATPQSIYGDKVVALAMRPYLKHRDFFDLWWLRTQMGLVMNDDDAVAAVRSSCAVYGYSDDTITERAAFLLTLPPSEIENLEQNLKAFLPERVHDAFSREDAFRDMFTGAMNELERVRHLLSQTPVGAFQA